MEIKFVPTNAGPIYTFLCAHTHTHTNCLCINVCSCGKGWLILSNSMATLHLPTGTRFIPLAAQLHIATSTDKLMEHLITVFVTTVDVYHIFINKSKKAQYFHNSTCTFFFSFFLLYYYRCQILFEWIWATTESKAVHGKDFWLQTNLSHVPVDMVEWSAVQLKNT